MSRIVVALLATLAALGVAGTPAPALAATATTVCTVTDDRVIGVSGLVATGDGFVAVADSNLDSAKVRIWYLDRRCRVTGSVRYPTRARDPEDLAMGRDGTLYVADIGDNDRNRPSIAVWRLPPGQTTPEIFRYAYPDGAHDAEAMLLAADDTPIFVTKDPLVAGVYVPTGPADPSGTPVRLRKVGSFTLTPTDTSDGVGPLGGFVVTGAAESPDRHRVALRSYNDAYEWDVPGDDVVAAITTTKPRITPLPGEPQGESIAYSTDGRDYYTVSDEETEPVRTRLLRYPAPAVPGPTTTPGPTGAQHTPGTPGAAAPGRTGHPVAVVGGIAAAGVVLVGAGLWAVSRRRRPALPPPARGRATVPPPGGGG